MPKKKGGTIYFPEDQHLDDGLLAFLGQDTRVGRKSGPRRATSVSDPLEVGWVAVPEGLAPGRLGVTIAPGKQGRGVLTDVVHARNLATDLKRLKAVHRADVLCDCTEARERELLGNAALPVKAGEQGITYLELPIVDVTAPRTAHDAELAVNQVTHLASAVLRGDTVVVNCRGGRGRSGMIAACVLVALGVYPTAAIDLVRAGRRGAIETREQEGFVWQAALRLLRLDWGDPAWVTA